MATGDPIYLNSGSLGDPTKDFYGVTTTGGTVASSTTRARSGYGRSILITRTSAADVSCRWYSGSTGMPAYASGINQATMFFWINVSALPASGNTPHIIETAVLNGAPWDVYVDLDSSGNLTLYHGSRSSTFGTVSTSDVWHLVEVQADCSTNPQTYSAKLDGGTAVSLTSANAATTMSGGILGPGGGTVAGNWTIYFQDFGMVSGLTWMSTSGNPNVKMLLPDSTAADLDTTWAITGGGSTRMAATSEIPPDDATTYISTTTTSQVQRLHLTTFTLGGSDSVKGVMWFGRMGSTTTTAGPAATVTAQDSSGTDNATTASFAANANGFKIPSAVLVHTTPPAGGSWSQAQVDGLRLKLTSSTSGGVAVRCTFACGWMLVVQPTSTTYTVSLSGSQAQSPTAGRTVGLPRGLSQAQSGGVSRLVSRVAVGSQAQPGLAQRAVTHALAGSQGQPGATGFAVTRLVTAAGSQAQAGSTGRVIGRGVGGAQAQAGTMARLVARRVGGTQAQPPVASRRVGRVVSVSQPQPGVVGRLVGHAVAGVQAQPGSVANPATRRVAVTGSQPHPGAVTRQMSLPRSGTQGHPGVTARSVAHALTGGQTQSGLARRAVAHVLGGAQGQAGTVVKGLAYLITVTFAQANPAAVTRRVQMGRSGAQPQNTTVTRGVARTIAATQPQPASISRTAGRMVAATQAAAATTIRTVGRLLAALQSQPGTVRRARAATLAAGQPQPGVVARLVARLLAGTQGTAGVAVASGGTPAPSAGPSTVTTRLLPPGNVTAGAVAALTVTTGTVQPRNVEASP